MAHNQRYQKILQGCLLEYKNVLNFIWFHEKFHNRHHTITEQIGCVLFEPSVKSGLWCDQLVLDKKCLFCTALPLAKLSSATILYYNLTGMEFKATAGDRQGAWLVKIMDYSIWVDAPKPQWSKMQKLFLMIWCLKILMLHTPGPLRLQGSKKKKIKKANAKARYWK